MHTVYGTQGTRYIGIPCIIVLRLYDCTTSTGIGNILYCNLYLHTKLNVVVTMSSCTSFTHCIFLYLFTFFVSPFSLLNLESNHVKLFHIHSDDTFYKI